VASEIAVNPNRPTYNTPEEACLQRSNNPNDDGAVDHHITGETTGCVMVDNRLKRTNM
jgi:hypothetical protein